MERYYIVFSGRVQGVGFRWFCQTEAAHLGLTGWVRNLDNGDVDCEVEGSPVPSQNVCPENKSREPLDPGRFVPGQGDSLKA